MMGGIGRPRVHGALRRRARTRSRWRPATPRTSRSPAPSRRPVELPPPLDEPREVPTPGLTTVEEVSEALGVPRGRAAQGGAGHGRGARPGDGARARRPPPERDQARATRLGEDFRQATPEEIEAEIGPRRLHRAGRRERPGHQGRGDPGRGLRLRREQARRPPDRGRARAATSSSRSCDVRSVEAGDTRRGGGAIEIEPAIEVGNIFKLGTRYSEPLGATYLDESGNEHPIVMGSYGIGPARIVAAAVEQGADEQRHRLAARRWRRGRSTLVGLGKGGDEVDAGGRAALRGAGGARARRPLDDRDAGAGGEAHRRRADRLPAAARGRQARARRGPGRGAGARDAARTSELELARRGAEAAALLEDLELEHGRRAVPGASAASAAGGCSALDRSGPRPAADPRRRAAAAVDAPEPDRLPAAGRDPGLPGAGASAPTTAATPRATLIYLCDRARRLRRRLRRPRDRPVQPHGRAARPGRRPADGARRRGRLLAFRAAAALGARRAGGRARSRPWCWPGSALRRGRRPRDQLGRPDRASSW